MAVTASHLYDYIHCPHRVTMDLIGDRYGVVMPLTVYPFTRRRLFTAILVESIASVDARKMEAAE